MLTRQHLSQHRATSQANPNLSPSTHHHGSPRPQLDVNADLLAAISAALGSAIPNVSTNVGPSQPGRKFFSRTITNTTSELPISVIKELKNGFKAYIPMSLCTHKACSNAMRSTDAFDTEIGMNERGEIRLKQKTFTAAKDHSITTDDFTEIRENFTRGMRKYLILGDDILPAGERALDCADMFQEFFSIIAARLDYTQDWPSYRGYIIESYTSWIGRRDDSFGLIFDEHLFHKYKMKNLIPSLLEQLRPPAAMSSTFGSHRMQGVAGSSGGSGFRGRPKFSHGSSSFNPHRGGYSQPFLGQPSTSTFKCYLCGEPHSHREHQGNAKRLITNEHGKWVDRLLGNKIVCIAFNVATSGCRRGSSCSYSHSCSLCGDLSHGSARCPA
ncbi:hypothetical protein BYT27DRAFT_6403982 [Phlegmacium glaucopus]|nr:hypothetical protein BYT27DRAFT_6403982 [Phlegmacium glaucopus]